MSDAEPLPATARVTVPDDGPWRSARRVADALHSAGHETWFVGGCVRDLLIGRAVQDVDVATDAPPERVEQVCGAAGLKTIAVGKAFGVVVAVVDGDEVEVATFRSDGAYIDGRRPTSVIFASAREDVERRDFTINALLLDPSSGTVVDHVGGLADLRDRVLRMVGDPVARLREDRLRVLRGVRFLAQLGLSAEPATWTALCATGLDGLSAERLMDEWRKGLLGPNRGALLEALGASGALGGLCPPLAAALNAPPLMRRAAATLDRLAADDDLAVRATTWLLPCAGLGRAWLERQPLPRALVTAVAWLLERAVRPDTVEAAPVAERRRILRHPHGPALGRVLRAAWPDSPFTLQVVAWLADEARQPTLTPLLRADDLIALGYRPGRALGAALHAIEDGQLDGSLADRAAAVAFAQRRLERDAAGGDSASR